MKKSLVQWVCLLTLMLIIGQNLSASDAPLTSAKRYKEITTIVREYHRAGEDLNDPDVRDAIMAQVSEKYELEPKKQADRRSTKELAAAVREIVAKKFPESAEQVKKRALAIAAAKYKLHKRLDYVTVRYQRGEISYTVEGIFYNYGGNSVKVGDRIIAIYDMVPDSRIKFDKVYCESEKKKFIDKQLSQYYQKKNIESLDAYRDLKDEQIETNERRGYVFLGKEWLTPKQVTLNIINTYATKIIQDPQVADGGTATPGDPAPDKQPDKQPDKPDKPDTPPDAAVAVNDPGKTTATPDDVPLPGELKYKEVKAKADQLRKEIVKTHAGIDADQGYKDAIWGFTREEVNILLSKYIAPGSTGDIEYIKFPSGQIESVELHFYQDYFYKVVIHFRIFSNEQMTRLENILVERYGLTDEQKKADAEAAAKPKEEVTEEEKAAEEKPEGEQPAPPPLPREVEIHWSGKVTLGTVKIRYNEAHTAYESFTLTKESYDTINKVNEIIKKRRAREETERRKKELEKWKGQKIDF